MEMKGSIPSEDDNAEESNDEEDLRVGGRKANHQRVDAKIPNAKLQLPFPQLVASRFLSSNHQTIEVRKTSKGNPPPRHRRHSHEGVAGRLVRYQLTRHPSCIPLVGGPFPPGTAQEGRPPTPCRHSLPSSQIPTFSSQILPSATSSAQDKAGGGVGVMR